MRLDAVKDDPARLVLLFFGAAHSACWAAHESGKFSLAVWND